MRRTGREMRCPTYIHLRDMVVRRVYSRNEHKTLVMDKSVFTNLHYLLLMHQDMNNARKNILVDFTYDPSTYKKNIANIVEFVLSNVPREIFLVSNLMHGWSSYVGFLNISLLSRVAG